MPRSSGGGMVWDRTTPCESCPYRRDAKRGLWGAIEFTTLIEQDRNELEGAMYGCHEFNRRPPEEHRPCAGWLLDQKERGVPSIRLRLALMTNEEARACFEAADPNGLELFSSIKEMVTENMKRMNKPVVPREFEIYRKDKWGGTPTGVIIPAVTKTEAVHVAREKLGKGAWEAYESSPAIRAEQARRSAETRRKLAEQQKEIPALVVGDDLSLASEDE